MPPPLAGRGRARLSANSGDTNRHQQPWPATPLRIDFWSEAFKREGGVFYGVFTGESTTVYLVDPFAHSASLPKVYLVDSPPGSLLSTTVHWWTVDTTGLRCTPPSYGIKTPRTCTYMHMYTSEL